MYPAASISRYVQLVLVAHELGRLTVGLGEHRLAPRPEVASCRAPPQRPLERVAVRVHEARESERARHAGDASRVAGGIGVLFRRVLGGVSPLDPERADDRALRRDPGLRRGSTSRRATAPAWGAGVFFAAAALTDQLDGYLARRWQVESRFGTVADPLADRLMIGTAAVLMLATGRIPLLAALVILGRDVALVLGYRILSPGRATSSRSPSSGKTATWVLYASLGFVLVTPEGTTWPLVLLWIGIALSLGAGVQYALRAWRQVHPGRDSRVEREPSEAEVST